MKRVVCMVGLGLAWTAGCSSPQNALDRRWVGQQAPDFELEDLDGAPVKLSAYRGRPLILAFWAYN